MPSNPDSTNPLQAKRRCLCLIPWFPVQNFLFFPIKSFCHAMFWCTCSHCTALTNPFLICHNLTHRLFIAWWWLAHYLLVKWDEEQEDNCWVCNFDLIRRQQCCPSTALVTIDLLALLLSFMTLSTFSEPWCLAWLAGLDAHWLSLYLLHGCHFHSNLTYYNSSQFILYIITRHFYLSLLYPVSFIS